MDNKLTGGKFGVFCMIVLKICKINAPLFDQKSKDWQLLASQWSEWPDTQESRERYAIPRAHTYRSSDCDEEQRSGESEEKLHWKEKGMLKKQKL